MRSLLLLLLSAGSYTVSYGQTVSDYLQQGADALGRGQQQPAYQAYKEAVALDGENLEALRGMAATAENLRYAAIARETYKKILQLKNADTAAIRHLALLCFQTRQWPEAIDQAKHAILLNLGSGYEWIIAKSYYEMKEYRSTLEYLEKSRKKDSSNAEAAFISARCQMEMNNYQRAVAAYEEAIRLDPGQPSWKFEAGMVYLALNDTRNGVKWLENALANGYPRNGEILENLMNGYAELKNYEQATAMATELLKESPNDPELLATLGEIQLRNNQYPAAIGSFEKILAADPRNAKAVFLSGIAHIKAGDKSKGESLCDRAIQMDPALRNLRQQRTELGL